MAKCASCNSRKGKRNCPALGNVICSQCCGSKRANEIDCPDDCFYLGKSIQYFSHRQEAKSTSDFEREMKSIMGNENQHTDILQHIELTINKVYTRKKDINDKDVETALEHLLEMGKAQMDLPSKFLTELPANVQNIVDAVNDILISRESFTGEKDELMVKLKCIYRVLDSVRTHYEPSNDCSYLNFIGQFLG